MCPCIEESLADNCQNVKVGNALLKRYMVRRILRITILRVLVVFENGLLFIAA